MSGNTSWFSDQILQSAGVNYSATMPTNASFLGDSSQTGYNWGVLLLVPIVLFGITGNILVCMAVSMEKRLQTVTNYFLFSLALTDLHVCIIVMPISIVNDFFGYWRFNIALCNVFVTSDVLMCTSSILHLCSISLERYLAIRNPLKSRNKAKSFVLLKIALIWTAAAAISSPVTVLGIIDESNILNNRQCVLKNNNFIIYGSILAFFIPLIIMVVSYGQTIRLLHQQSSLYDPNGNVAQSGQPMMRRVKSRRKKCMSDSSPSPSRHSLSLTRDQNVYELCSKDTNTEFLNNFKRVPNIISQSASCETLYTPSVARESTLTSPEYTTNTCFLSVPGHQVTGTSSESLISDNESSEEDSKSFTVISGGADSPSKRSLRDVMTQQIIVKASSILNLTREKNVDKTAVRTEQKASKVLGFVFALFVMCWTPFFVVNILQVICKTCSFNPVLMSTFVWLGWISSTINPIIYTMFNCTFKQTFVKLLKCQYGFIQKPRNRKFNSSTRNTFYSDYNLKIPL